MSKLECIQNKNNLKNCRLSINKFKYYCLVLVVDVIFIMIKIMPFPQNKTSNRKLYDGPRQQKKRDTTLILTLLTLWFYDQEYQ